MEADGEADEVGERLEGDAMGELRVFEAVDGGEVLVDKRQVGQQPQMFGGLQLQRIRWQNSK